MSYMEATTNPEARARAVWARVAEMKKGLQPGEDLDVYFTRVRRAGDQA
jgi:hypothetical protein